MKSNNSNYEEKVLNFHLTDRCNFKCKHCFVNMQQEKELSLDKCKSIIDNISDMNDFTRINLAGGEPLLVNHLQEVIDYIVKKGFRCSIITNGSKLDESFIKKNKDKLSMIGISIDSMDDNINKKIGRKTIKNLNHLCRSIKENEITLKVNICISKININCDFKEFLESVKPDRLKLFQLLPTPHSKESKYLTVCDKEFKTVCNQLSKYNPICEDNDYMQKVYIPMK
ncbi:MAG: viperin family antiviral radical SAM protein [archaeon]